MHTLDHFDDKGNQLDSSKPQELIDNQKVGENSDPGFRNLPNDNNISDNQIRKLSKFYCHGISQEKQRFGTIFRKFSSSPTPSKTQILLILSFRRL